MESLIKTLVKSAFDAAIAVIFLVGIPLVLIMFLVKPGDLPIPDVYWRVPGEFVSQEQNIEGLEIDADGAPVVLYGDQSINLISGEVDPALAALMEAIGPESENFELPDTENLKTLAIAKNMAVNAEVRAIYLSADNEIVEVSIEGQEKVLLTLADSFRPHALAYEESTGAVWAASDDGVFRLLGDGVESVWQGRAQDIAIHGDDLYIALANPDAVFRRPASPGLVAEAMEAGRNLTGLIQNAYLMVID